MKKSSILCILCFCWMGIIFYFSMQTGSESQALSDSVENSLFNSNEARAQLLRLIIRKLAHMGEFSILALAWFFALRSLLIQHSYRYAFIICTLYACTDEIHQLFVKGRSAQFSDIIIDCIAITSTLLLIKIVYYVRARAKKIPM